MHGAFLNVFFVNCGGWRTLGRKPHAKGAEIFLRGIFIGDKNLFYFNTVTLFQSSRKLLEAIEIRSSIFKAKNLCLGKEKLSECLFFSRFPYVRLYNVRPAAPWPLDTDRFLAAGGSVAIPQLNGQPRSQEPGGGGRGWAPSRRSSARGCERGRGAPGTADAPFSPRHTGRQPRSQEPARGGRGLAPGGRWCAAGCERCRGAPGTAWPF